jgi:hypothetical protein
LFLEGGGSYGLKSLIGMAVQKLKRMSYVKNLTLCHRGEEQTDGTRPPYRRSGKRPMSRVWSRGAGWTYVSGGPRRKGGAWCDAMSAPNVGNNREKLYVPLG